MSYVRIVVYSFECDHEGCTEVADVTPVPTRASQSLLGAARLEVRDTEGWTWRDGGDYCRTHRTEVRR